MCLASLYYVYKASRSCLLHFLCHPYIPHYNLKNFSFVYVYSMYVDFQLQNTDKHVYAQAKVRTKRIKGTESIPMNY